MSPSPPTTPLARTLRLVGRGVLASLPLLLPPTGLEAQAPIPAEDPAWVFHTFSIVAVDAETGETGVAVTTRNACVGNGVPWVRAGVGAVATQASTRPEYGTELLDRIGAGQAPEEALRDALADDPAADRRQIGVVDLRGRTAQHTGTGANAWAGQVAGEGFAVQGNLLVGPEVLDAVAADFRGSAGSGRHLADRLVSALEAGQARGGDARHGRAQSAAVLVADPREDVARRPDGQTVFIHVCEHPEAVAELRRTHDAVAGTLGHRTLQAFEGGDVAQLKILLNLLGYLEPDLDSLPEEGLTRFDAPTVDAVDRFREDQGLGGAGLGVPPGTVDAEVVRLLWTELEARGLAPEARTRIRPFTQIRR
ncbi:MAG TPA: DUF1028 domain-containing protein [Longimicrobiales bacterium]|nr:DUF1028 domain-containing protein [Longimicrobiales bacterium]